MDDRQEPLTLEQLKRLKAVTGVLIGDVGETESIGISKLTAGDATRFSNTDLQSAPRFIGIDIVMQLEALADKPHLTAVLAELNGSELQIQQQDGAPVEKSVEEIIDHLTEQFALMTTCHDEYKDGPSSDETQKAKLLSKINAFQDNLILLKLILGAI